ncbi:MAG: restriction endonuclease subunit M, partial [Armatimonadetes bacterium]|nr:restriction endonuclease subunit M [Armatimonadota bacterium]
EYKFHGKADLGVISMNKISSMEWNFSTGIKSLLFEKLIQVTTKLGDISYRMFQGVITSADTVFLFKEFEQQSKKEIRVYSKESNTWFEIESDILKPIVRSGDIRRYTSKPSVVALFPYEVKGVTATLHSESEIASRFPKAWKYLKSHEKLLRSRERRAFDDNLWYRYGRTQNLGMWEQSKIMIPYMLTTLAAYPDRSDNFYFVNVTTGGYGITLNESYGSQLYVTGLLNSKTLDWFLKQVSSNFRGGYFAANKQYIEQLPIRTIDFTNPEDVRQHDQMVALVERMLSLHKKQAEATTAHEKTNLTRQIEATDQQIDKLVYELYGLTEEEIGIVKGEKQQ